VNAKELSLKVADPTFTRALPSATAFVVNVVLLLHEAIVALERRFIRKVDLRKVNKFVLQLG
jgi:hypothetical protein